MTVMYSPNGGGSTGGGGSIPAANQVTVTAATYTITASNFLVLVDTTSNAITLTLPNPTGYATIYIKDKAGNLATNNLTVARFGSEKIEGLAASKVFQSAWGAWTFQSNGTDWFLL